MKKRFMLVILIVSMLIFWGCAETPVENNQNQQCNNITCSGHGNCAVVNGNPTCACESGYYPEDLNCLENLEEDGPTEDSAFANGNIETVAGGGGECSNYISETIDVPWISQKLSSLSWDHNMCCGPTSITMIKGYMDGNYNLQEDDLKETIDWMDQNISTFSKTNYTCDDGTDNTEVTKTIKDYLGLETKASYIEWCELVKKLDGNHIIIFNGDAQGSNNTKVFKSGASHWLILERVDKEFAYINDPGRTPASQGNSRKYTIDSVRRSYERYHKLAIITNINPNTCNTSDPIGTITSPTNNQIISTNFDIIGTVTDDDKIKKVTATIGSDQNCKFSKQFNGTATSENFLIPIDINGNCKLKDGSNRIAIWVEDNCGTKEKIDKILTINFQENIDCSGSSTQNCNIPNGSGEQSRTCNNGSWSSWESCQVTSCNNGYHQSGNSCVENSPVVDSVSPLTATVGELTTFTVRGSNFSSDLAFWIGNCEGLEQISISSTVAKWRCTPNSNTGYQDGIVKDGPGGTTLKVFRVNVTGCTPHVSSVSPLSAYLNQSKTFTISGTCLPTTTTFWLANCANPTKLSGATSTRVRYSCTPSYGGTGYQDGDTRDRPGGTILKTFRVYINN